MTAVAVIGSANMDMRSLFLNYELGVFMRSPAQITDLEAWFQLATFPLCVPAPPKSSADCAPSHNRSRGLLAPLE